MKQMQATETINARPGDELPAQLEGYLRDKLQISADEPYQVRQFPGGYSNLTYLIRFGDQGFVLRRPPRGTKAKSAHDMGREFTVLSKLQGQFAVCPKPLLYSEDESLIGSPFYVMSLIPGLIIRKNLPENISPQQYAEQVKNMIQWQAKLHSLDPQKLGLEDFGHLEGYVARQVSGWSKRYLAVRTDDAPDFEEVMTWLASHVDEIKSPRASLIHNDFKLDNLVFDPENPAQVIGVLDWEMATIGDPWMDLGCSLAYWVQADDPAYLQAMRTLPSHLKDAPSRLQQLAIYEEASGYRVDNWHFYYTFGLFRLAVIAQQIYYRYAHGQTQDERFAQLIHGVRALEKAAQLAKKKQLQ
ncbi:MAG: phosphotransferase family protein [Oligoflexus sp.]